MNRKMFFVSTFVCAAFWAFLQVGLASDTGLIGSAHGETENPLAHEINVTGTVVASRGGFIIRGQTPREIFRIINPIPEILYRIAESGRTVKIEVRIVQGDNIAIERIDGQVYRRTEPGQR